MIWIDSVKLVEVRGIRELDLNLGRKSFVISGPNGSGKSGVIDGVQFALTGEISRLAGKGTAGLTVQRHGPHVDRRDDPAVAIVTLNIFLPETQKTAVLTRNMKRPTNYSLVPNDPDIRSVIEEVAQHPELTLSRREIIKYILVEAGERSSEIQALLK
jgi:DNA repair exonuclease SbcCD ATPase subunit